MSILKSFFYIVFSLTALLFAGVSCTNYEALNEPSGPNIPGQSVSTVKVEGHGNNVSRSSFNVGTQYRMVIVSKGFKYTDTGYQVTADSVFRYNGRAEEVELPSHSYQYLKVADESKPNDVWFGFSPAIEEEQGRRSLSFYAFTHGKTAENTATDELVFDEGTYVRTEQVDEKGELVDLMRGVLSEQNDATSQIPCVIPFRHTFSMLDFKVSQLESESSAGQGMYKLGIERVEVTGTYKQGKVDLFSGKTILDGKDKYESGRVLNMVREYGSGEYVGIKSQDLGSMIVFPSDGRSLEGTTESYTLGLKIILKGSRDELAKFVSSEDISLSADGSYYMGEYVIDKLYSSILDENSSSSPLYLVSGSKYTLQLVLMEGEVRVITLVPSQVEWMPGETSEGGDYGEIVIGQPLFFDNTIWMDRNLGANEADPAVDFVRTVGYYYQTNRNIPYWPYKLESFPNLVEKRPKLADRYLNSLAEYSAWGNPKFKVYPVIDDDIMERDPLNDRWRTDNSNNQLFYTLHNADDNSGSYIFYSGSANVPEAWTRNNSWTKVENQPVPPGWELPTKEQFQSIFPTTAFAGNITFLKLYHDGSDWRGEEGELDKNYDVLRICVPFYTDGLDTSKGAYYSKWQSVHDPGAYPDRNAYAANHSPYNYLDREPDGDPAPGYCSVYIISRKGNDKGTISYNYPTKEWGTIYGIKKVGTPEAYRMRWKVMNAQPDPAKFPVLYVKVSMYSCAETDNLTVDNFESYDWDYPSSEMFFPLTGSVEGRTNTVHPTEEETIWIGAGYASCGSSVRYACASDNAAMHIKITGDNKTNQYMSVVSNDIQSNAKQIRLVKSKY